MNQATLEKFREVWRAVNSARIDAITEPELYDDELEIILFEIESKLDLFVNHATFKGEKIQ